MTGTVQAPGKITLAGEYGVLGGGPVLVAAVDLYARARFASAPEVDGVEVASAAEGIEPFVVPPGGLPDAGSRRALYAAIVSSTLAYLRSRDRDATGLRVTLDLLDLREGEGSLGMGATGASAVALAAALFEAAGLAVQGPARRWDLLTLAAYTQSIVRGPMASGADVAAATYGGVAVYRRGGAVRSVALPDGVRWVVIRSEGGLRTGSMLFRAPGDSGSAARATEALSDVARAAERVVDRLDEGAAPFLAALREFREATDLLGERTGVMTMTMGMRKVAARCDGLGVIAKGTPTEGEGDLGLLLSDDEGRLEAALKECEELGFQRLRVRLDPLGASVATDRDRD